jgi:glycosyltransferase involved in cell wall biosynthesis
LSDLLRFSAASLLRTRHSRSIDLGLVTAIRGIMTLIQDIEKLRSELQVLKRLRDLQHLVRNKGIGKHIVFHSAAQGSMALRYYKSADIFVLSSRHEGFGITSLEAMASRIPIIASDIESF